VAALVRSPAPSLTSKVTISGWSTSSLMSYSVVDGEG